MTFLKYTQHILEVMYNTRCIVTYDTVRKLLPILQLWVLTTKIDTLTGNATLTFYHCIYNWKIQNIFCKRIDQSLVLFMSTNWVNNMGLDFDILWPMFWPIKSYKHILHHFLIHRVRKLMLLTLNLFLSSQLFTLQHFSM